MRYLAYTTVLSTVVGSAAIYIGTSTVFNVTPSLPPGFYWRQHIGTLERGMIVEVRTPPNFLPYLQGIPAMMQATSIMKHLTGLPGDTVCWEPDTMSVNGQPLAARTLIAERPGLDQVQGCRTLRRQEVVLTGTHPCSVDSRYLGPVDLQRLRYRLWPLWTWRGKV